MKIHPLINPKATHYYDDDGETTIEKLEKELNVDQMIGACMFNIGKYRSRAGRKGAKEQDMEKIEDYQRYLEALLNTPMGYRLYKVADMWKAMNIEWEYRV